MHCTFTVNPHMPASHLQGTVLTGNNFGGVEHSCSRGVAGIAAVRLSCICHFLPQCSLKIKTLCYVNEEAVASQFAPA